MKQQPVEISYVIAENGFYGNIVFLSVVFVKMNRNRLNY